MLTEREREKERLGKECGRRIKGEGERKRKEWRVCECVFKREREREREVGSEKFSSQKIYQKIVTRGISSFSGT